ncbi:hypothetical protein SUGI_0601010 [Cryptomeria japonica]|uniref:protein METABOLIC NETWORK MODULATOR 1 n=1 Tax=Cryptomeria japonica TaxID=3369 RepID=UPI0024147BA5|nr:protein METABOLIC NETWORK MODULATOR 1 [Cryptomeria japonica]XP_057820385.1 protein METABOLIC NETWORK MODULATOR 1 [Cryptomeria japonica]GLJ30377.1 hypothetical protein SUGI_0601010 [Cryptomeria japonica]
MEGNFDQGADVTLKSPIRKRGRPCKADIVLVPKEVAVLGVPSMSDSKPLKAGHKETGISQSSLGSNSLIGQTVQGVLDGSFDAGYLITVRIGESDTIFRGVVFGPGLSIPPSKLNDAASNVKQIKRDKNSVASNVKKAKKDKKQTPVAPAPVTLLEVYKPAPTIESTTASTVMTDMEVELKNRLEVLPQQNDCLGLRSVPEVSNAVDEDFKFEICDPVEAIKACLRNQCEPIQDDAHIRVKAE